MEKIKSNNPLHGITLEKIVIALQEKYGWEGLSERINIRCFTFDPSVKSSLAFLRRTPWARKKVEELYLLSQGNNLREEKTDKKQWPDMKL
jgi:uncharacterized protein (DUF2132 family)